LSSIPEIKSNQSVELLQALHILTRDGKINQDGRRKLKQIYHLYHFIEPLLSEVITKNPDFTIVDHGAGKSYLGFILYDLFMKEYKLGKIISIEMRAELVKNARELAERLSFERMVFECLSAEESIQLSSLPEQVDMVTALHACDTATDDAIQFGLKKQARFMALIPCCQAEIAQLLRKNKNTSFSKTPLSEIWRHPVHTREFGSQITNVLRCLQLEAHGYQVTVTELVGWEHSIKNELILARYCDNPRKNAENRLEQILQMLNLEELGERFMRKY